MNGPGLPGPFSLHTTSLLLADSPRLWHNQPSRTLRRRAPVDDVPANFDELRELLFADQILDDALADANLNGTLADARDLLQAGDPVGAEALLADVDDAEGDEERAWRFFI